MCNCHAEVTKATNIVNHVSKKYSVHLRPFLNIKPYSHTHLVYALPLMSIEQQFNLTYVFAITSYTKKEISRNKSS